MIHPDTELKFISPEIGHGVVATAFIPKGTITWAMDPLDREFKPEYVLALPKLFQDILEKYTYRNNKGNHILCWDHARFVNHSFRSNCLTTAYEFEIAIRDIHPGEELTDDYGYLNISEPFHAQPEGTDRSVVYPDDTLRYHPQWDALLSSAFPLITELAQPLRMVMADSLWNKVERINKGDEKMDSILTTFYDPARVPG